MAERITTGGKVGKPTPSPRWKAAVRGARKASAWNATGVPEQSMRPEGSTGTWESQKPPCKINRKRGVSRIKRDLALRGNRPPLSEPRKTGDTKKGEEQGIEARSDEWSVREGQWQS